MSKSVLLRLSSKSFIVPGIAFIFLINFEFIFVYGVRRGFTEGSVVKYLPAMLEQLVLSLGLKDPLEKKMATYYSILA